MGIDAHLTTVAAVIGVARELYWSELGGVEVEGTERERESARTMLVAMLGHVGIYFPFGGDALGERTAEVGSSSLSCGMGLTSRAGRRTTSFAQPHFRFTRLAPRPFGTVD